MHVKTFDNVTNAQTGAAININHPPRQIRPTKSVEAVLTGTFGSITTAIEVSPDGSTDWGQVAVGSAGDDVVRAETAAPFVRIVTTGTGTPYDVDVYVGRLAT